MRPCRASVCHGKLTPAIHMTLPHFLSSIQIPDVGEYLTRFSYLGIFIWFTVFDFFAPFPDELSLLTVGYFASQGVFNPFLAAGLIIFSFVLTDSISFYLARGGSSLLKKKLKRPKAHTFRGWVVRNLERHLPRTLILVCFIPRMRIWGPLAAGSVRIPYKKFIAFDFIGVALFTSLYVTLGYFFGETFSMVFRGAKMEETALLVGLFLLFGLALLIIYVKVNKDETKHGRASYD